MLLSPQAAADFLRKMRELRAENAALREGLDNERASVDELTAAVGDLREQIKAEREASQEAITALENEAAAAGKQARRERAKANTVGIIGGVAVILALVF